MKTTPVSTNRIHFSLKRSALVLIPLLLACFALSPQAQAACEEGCLVNANTVLGDDALFSLTFDGTFNTATGFQALFSTTTGSFNTAIGGGALFNADGSSNIAVGFQAGINLTTSSNNIDIGNPGVAGESRTIRIGTTGSQTKTYVAGISGVTVPGGVGVIVGTNGKLGTVVSSERFKDAIKPMDKASEAILSLQPVTFRYKQELDPDGIPQFGLVAEEVEKVNPALVARDEQGKAYTVRYDAVNAMLLNEFLKEHRRNEKQEATIAELKSTVAQQHKQIDALTAGLQKVSAQLELSKSALRTVQK
jgi:trimeric autotransporter adhesin